MWSTWAFSWQRNATNYLAACCQNFVLNWKRSDCSMGAELACRALYLGYGLYRPVFESRPEYEVFFLNVKIGFIRSRYRVYFFGGGGGKRSGHLI
jgi:hypothetical protein